jgi:protein TonB
MSYTDKKGLTTGQIYAIGIVVLVHLLLAWAFITGLAQSVAKKVAQDLNVIDVQEPPPPPEKLPPPPPQPKNLPPPPVQTPPPLVTTNNPVVNPIVAPPPTPQPVFTPPAPPAPTPAPPPPPPPPPPAPPPVKLSPRGNPSAWMSDDDYPPSAIRDEAAGTAGYRLEVNEQGRVSGCTITQSTGNSALDATTCRLLTSRAKFTPGRDASGNSVGGIYPGRVTWRLPQN